MGSCLSNELYVMCMDCNEGVYDLIDFATGMMMGKCNKCGATLGQYQGWYECTECKAKICQSCHKELGNDDTNLTKQKPKKVKLTKEEDEMLDKIDKMVIDVAANKHWIKSHTFCMYRIVYVWDHQLSQLKTPIIFFCVIYKSSFFKYHYNQLIKLDNDWHDPCNQLDAI